MAATNPAAVLLTLSTRKEKMPAYEDGVKFAEWALKDSNMSPEVISSFVTADREASQAAYNSTSTCDYFRGSSDTFAVALFDRFGLFA